MFRFFHQVFTEEGIFEKVDGTGACYYLTLGGEEVMSRELEYFTHRLEENAPSSLRWRFVMNAHRNHDSNALHSYMNGLDFIFNAEEP